MQPEDIYAWEQAPVVSQPKYTLGPRSLVLLVDTGGCRQTKDHKRDRATDRERRPSNSA